MCETRWCEHETEEDRSLGEKLGVCEDSGRCVGCAALWSSHPTDPPRFLDQARRLDGAIVVFLRPSGRNPRKRLVAFVDLVRAQPCAGRFLGSAARGSSSDHDFPQRGQACGHQGAIDARGL